MTNPRHQRVSNEMICESIREYGPNAQIAIPPSCASMVYGHEIVSSVETVSAATLAVERIEELDEKRKAIEEWQEGLADFLEAMRLHPMMDYRCQVERLTCHVWEAIHRRKVEEKMRG